MFFLWHQAIKNQFVLRVSFNTTPIGIVGTQAGYCNGVPVIRVGKHPFHSLEVVSFNIKPALIVFVLRQDVLEINTLHTGLFRDVEIFIVRFRIDVTATVPVFLAITNQSKSHARFRTNVQSADRDIDLHRKEFLRASLRNSKHYRYV